MSSQTPVEVHGEVAPGFESVKTLFEKNMRTLAEENAQLCVYVGDERVVDLWASVPGNPGFGPDTLVNVFSSGKSLEAIAIASLVSNGLVSYGDKVTRYWPEFAANGKEGLTIADVLRHEAGLAAFDVSLDPLDLHTGNIKANKIGSIIENHAQKYRNGGDANRREYHAVTRGWILNEIFRRIDPGHRTIGEFVQQELREPLDADVFVGVPADELHRRVDITPVGIGAHIRAAFKPRLLGRKVKHNVFQLASRVWTLLFSGRNSTIRSAPPPFKNMQANLAAGIFNSRDVVMGETPSANAHCSARGLARLAAVMASGGKSGDTHVVSEEAWQLMHDAPIRRDMGMVTTFTQGGVAYFLPTNKTSPSIERALNDGREGFYGWMGLGGSLFQWHPEKKIGFAFVPTSLHILDFVNERGKAYQAEVLRCVDNR